MGRGLLPLAWAHSIQASGAERSLILRQVSREQDRRSRGLRRALAGGGLPLYGFGTMG